MKCKELEMLPLKMRLDFFAILLFHKIIHKTIAIDLPSYIRLVPQTILRTSHNDPLTFESTIKPRINRIAEKKKKENSNKNKKVSKKSNIKVVITKKKSKLCKKKTFFSKKRKQCKEKIYTDDLKTANANERNDKNHFSENKVFISSYFYKTHMQWNNFPLEIKIIEDYEKFKENLEQHLWDLLVEHDQRIDESFGVPVD